MRRTSNDSGFTDDVNEDDYASIRRCRYIRLPADKTGDEAGDIELAEMPV
jgi:hypothetical protein